jgi:hypothetical protein
MDYPCKLLSSVQHSDQKWKIPFFHHRFRLRTTQIRVEMTEWAAVAQKLRDSLSKCPGAIGAQPRAKCADFREILYRQIDLFGNWRSLLSWAGRVEAILRNLFRICVIWCSASHFWLGDLALEGSLFRREKHPVQFGISIKTQLPE